MRELLDQGVDPDDFETEDAEYDPGMTDEQLDVAHADMQEWLRDTAPVPTSIEIHQEMTYKDAMTIFERHGLEWHSSDLEIATVLGGLEAEIAKANAAAHEATNGYAAELWAWRAWAVNVADAWVDGERNEWMDGEGDRMIRLLHNMPHQAITDTPD